MLNVIQYVFSFYVDIAVVYMLIQGVQGRMPSLQSVTETVLSKT